MSALTLLLGLLTAQPLTTVAERSGWKDTGRYDEVITLCREFPRRYPGKVKCEAFGKTPEGRPMLALIASADGVLTAEATRKKQRPVVLFHGGIHAGEIDGKDAGFWLLRDLLDGKTGPGVLKAVTAVFVPVLNVDGHERFGPNQRPNQVGPSSMGWRVTADNLNLNRDFVKSDAEETRAVLRLLNAYEPILYLDLHVTDGAKFEHDVAVMIEPQVAGPESLRPHGVELRKTLFTRLEAQGHLPLPFYPSFIEYEDPTSGFAYGISPPRFSNSYWSLRNRFGVLVETHSWRPYPHRVKTTYDVVAGFLELAREHGREWLKAAQIADAKDAEAINEPVVLSWERSEKSEILPFRGVEYSFVDSPISGAKVVRYTDTPQLWKLPYFPEPRPARTAEVPAGGGYLIPPAHAAWVREKLALHGLSFESFKTARTMNVEVFRATQANPGSSSYEGRQRLEVKGEWKAESRVIPAGSLYVPLQQPGRRLAAHLFEPLAPDSLLAWGFFNAHFEQKEYIEDYVLEPWAREQLASDASLKSAFEQRLKDPEFAKSPSARMRFFYERHPSFDEAWMLYPVFRAAAK